MMQTDIRPGSSYRRNCTERTGRSVMWCSFNRRIRRPFSTLKAPHLKGEHEPSSLGESVIDLWKCLSSAAIIDTG
jgi:hypothetical protein